MHRPVILLSFFILLATGCAAPLGEFPRSQEEFATPKETLIGQYPEIQRHQASWSPFLASTPYISPLVDAWGDPDAARKKWEYMGIMGGTVAALAIIEPVPALIAGGIVLVIRPYPPELYFWRKGNYCIEVLSDRTVAHAYRRKMIHWKWHELAASQELPDECRRPQQPSSPDEMTSLSNDLPSSGSVPLR